MTYNLNKYTGILIKKAGRLFERISNSYLDEIGLTYAQTIFLVRLWERDGQNQTELTLSSGLRQPSVVDILNKMERDKLIKRVKNKQDKRIYNFYLTAKAKKACLKLENLDKMIQKILMGQMNTTTIDDINYNLITIISNLEIFLLSNEKSNNMIKLRDGHEIG